MADWLLCLLLIAVPAIVGCATAACPAADCAASGRVTYDDNVFQTHKAFDAVVETLLRMLDKDVIDYVRHCNQYFRLLRAYIQLVSSSAHRFDEHWHPVKWCCLRTSLMCIGTLSSGGVCAPVWRASAPCQVVVSARRFGVHRHPV